MAFASQLDNFVTGGLHGTDVHAVDLLARNVEREASLGEVGGRRRSLDGRPHRVLVVLDDEDDRQLPQLGHVEGLVDLSLVGGAVAEIA